jgi:hypothetical protein
MVKTTKTKSSNDHKVKVKATRKEIADALKQAVAWAFFRYRFSIAFEVGVQAWGARRADVIGSKISGEIVLIEVKSSVADFRSDTKWHEYLKYTDRMYLAFTLDVAKKINANAELMARIPKTVGVMVLGDDGYMKTVKKATRTPVAPDIRLSILARLAWRNGDLSKRTTRSRQRVFVTTVNPVTGERLTQEQQEQNAQRVSLIAKSRRRARGKFRKRRVRTPRRSRVSKD